MPEMDISRLFTTEQDGSTVVTHTSLSKLMGDAVGGPIDKRTSLGRALDQTLVRVISHFPEIRCTNGDSSATADEVENELLLKAKYEQASKAITAASVALEDLGKQIGVTYTLCVIVFVTC